jgi:hypothetical protein
VLAFSFVSPWVNRETPFAYAPRGGDAALHDSHELLVIAFCCVPCGGQGAVDMALGAEAKEARLRSFLTLDRPHSQPGHVQPAVPHLDPDQFSRFVSAIYGAVV